MLDTLKLYELRNKLYHLNTNINDDLFLNIFNNKDFYGKEKLDVIYATVYQTIKPMSSEIQSLTNEEIFNRCNTIIQQAVNLSSYDYTEEEVQRLTVLFWLSTVNPPTSVKEIEDTIKMLESLIIDDKELTESEQFINEELRLFLLSYYYIILIFLKFTLKSYSLINDNYKY